MGIHKRQREAEEANRGYIKKSSCIFLVLAALCIGIFVGNTVTMLTMGQRGGGETTSMAVPPADPSAVVVDKTALARLEQAAAADSTNENGWIELGNFCFDKGLPKKAIQAYERALELSPMHGDVWSDLGVMYRQDGQFKKAIDAFDQAAKVDPEHVTSRYNMGIVYYYDLNDKANALKVWKALVAENPDVKTPSGQPAHGADQGSGKVTAGCRQ